MSLLGKRLEKHPELYQVAQPVPEGEDVRDLLSTMKSVMFAGRGIGLAANQIGVLKRVIVIHAAGYRQDIINPVITKRYGGKHTAKEGCLSYPGLQVIKVRDMQIIVEGFGQNWQPIKRKLRGLAARCVQHEVDHLDGITIGGEE